MKASEKSFMENQGVKFVDVTPTIPICSCGKPMKPVYDQVAKRITGHLWTCACHKGLIMSIG